MKIYPAIVVVISIFFLSTASFAQDKAVHPTTSADAKIVSLAREMKATADSANYPRAASLAKEIIAMGQHDSSTYYTAALLLALSGNKQEGKLYYDTAITKGYQSEAGDVAKTLLGLDNNSSANINIDSTFEAIHTDAIAKSKSLPSGYKNTKLYEIYSEDQGERMLLVAQMQRTGQIPMPIALKMNGNDARRKKELYAMLSAHTVTAPKDLEEAALILQHGDDTTDFWTAHELALQAIALGDSDARQLAAITLDRYLVKQGKPQHFGTQAFQNEKTGKWELYPVDPTVTDAERARWDEPPLKEQLKRNMEMYGQSPKQ